jgi:hypothetical protein
MGMKFYLTFESRTPRKMWTKKSGSDRKMETVM